MIRLADKRHNPHVCVGAPERRLTALTSWLNWVNTEDSMNRRAIAIACLACSSCLWGELLPIRSYTIADGLPADQVIGIVPDSRGFVWFLTSEGLSRFD